MCNKQSYSTFSIKNLGMLCQRFTFITIFNYALVSGHREWWPPSGPFKVKCPYRKVDLSWYSGTVNPCPKIRQPICGTNVQTYDNPCILCIESMKSRGKIKFSHDGHC
ncbi:serine protease inhibitor Kazal-type 14 [Trichechus manatus latirostris]|uniref:Serine protease inhibitor Kazal-type 14 n=1 Tax=Trichechus manatus latirostris TaxID=127582 RepID=A0A2Y9RMS6_TRIMA|nr:serine protease inhibitor Kazal-type 14 [Trichechus manatus latirostris]